MRPIVHLVKDELELLRIYFMLDSIPFFLQSAQYLLGVFCKRAFNILAFFSLEALSAVLA
jgi:hypothetical protein